MGELTIRVTEGLQSAPEWVRRDLASLDVAIRVRAEDTLAAMIAAALDRREPTSEQSGAAATPSAQV